MAADEASELRRYEVSILIGPCSREDAERVMAVLHETAREALRGDGPGTALNYWDEDREEPGIGVDGVEVLG